jgi:Fe-S-cluster-containing hydrogenase component 2
MMRIKVEAEKCAGCRQCEMICSFHHTNKFSPSLARVTVHRDDRDGLDYPVMCHQCNQCPPLDTCSTGAISKTVEGWTWVDWQTCIGCGSCIEVCKYDSIKLAEEKALICNLCKGQPECVKRCPTKALEYKETPESTETPEHAFKMLREAWNFE